MAFETGTLTGTFLQFDGTPHEGHVEIIPSVRTVRDQSGDVILTGRAKVALSGGTFSVDLPASDDATLDPSGVTYTVSAKLRTTSGLRAVQGVFIEAGVTKDMADLVTLDPAAPSYIEWVNDAQAFAATATAAASTATTAASTATTAAGTATTAASTATTKAAETTSDRTAVATDRAAVEAIGTTNDTIIAGRINTPGSATRVTLDAEFAPIEGSAEYANIDEVQPRTDGVTLWAPVLVPQLGTVVLDKGVTPTYIPNFPVAKASGQTQFGSPFNVPLWATQVFATIIWSAATAAGTGVPRLRVAIGQARHDAGGSGPTTPTLPTSGDLFPALPATALTWQRTQFGPWTVDPALKGNMQVGRIGTSSSDTASGTTVCIIGVELLFS